MLAPKPDPAPLLVDSRRAAAMLAVSERTLWTLANSGELQRIKIGSAVRFAVSDLVSFVDSKKNAPRELRQIPAGLNPFSDGTK